MIKGIKGRSYNAVAAACLYTVCRQENVPRTFKGYFNTLHFYSFRNLCC